MIARLIADHIDDRRTRAAGVVQISQAICQAGRAMQQCARRLFGHPAVAVGGARRHAFEQTQDAVHSRHAVERGDEMHLARPGIRETRCDVRREQSADQSFSAVHE